MDSCIVKPRFRVENEVKKGSDELNRNETAFSRQLLI